MLFSTKKLKEYFLKIVNGGGGQNLFSIESKIDKFRMMKVVRVSWIPSISLIHKQFEVYVHDVSPSRHIPIMAKSIVYII